MLLVFSDVYSLHWKGMQLYSHWVLPGAQPLLLHFCPWCFFPSLGWALAPRPRRPRPPACTVSPGNGGSSLPAHREGSPRRRRAHVTHATRGVLDPAGLCSLAAMPLMKLSWTSLWFTGWEIFGIVYHWIYFVSVDFADINRDRMRPVLNSSENLSSQEFVFPWYTSK